MVEVLVYQGIPGRNNLELARKHLAEHGIASRGKMAGMSFESMPPISVNNLWVEEDNFEQALKLIEELAADGWLISRQRFTKENEGGDPK